ncbi:MAG: hypothetical protein C0518_08305 [Opitutus sp.]|nr:hypothetical protein [Opitutus sp.]
MSISAIPLAGSAASAASAAPLPTASASIDTTRGSLIHRLFASDPAKPAPYGLRLFAYSGLAVFLPLLALAALAPAGSTAPHRLPFFADLSSAFLFLVSLPYLFTLFVRDQHVLQRALHQVIDATVVQPSHNTAELFRQWEQRFTRINRGAQLGGVAVGGVIMAVNYGAYRGTGFWINGPHGLLPAGYLFLLAVFVFYFLVTVYFVRSVSVSVMLRDIVASSRIEVIPFHPDRCGGLLPVGRIGLRNQYLLTVLGLNVLLLAVITTSFLGRPPGLQLLIGAAVVAYVVLGPVVFVGPLLPFRDGMRRTKEEMMSAIARRLRTELAGVRARLAEESVTETAADSINRLKDLGAMVEELPVWPFDAATMKKFVSAYLLPLAGAFGYAQLKDVLSIFFS